MSSSYYYTRVIATTAIFTGFAGVNTAGEIDPCFFAKTDLGKASYMVLDAAANIGKPSMPLRVSLDEYRYARAKQFDAQQAIKKHCP